MGIRFSAPVQSLRDACEERGLWGPPLPVRRCLHSDGGRCASCRKPQLFKRSREQRGIDATPRHVHDKIVAFYSEKCLHVDGDFPVLIRVLSRGRQRAFSRPADTWQRAPLIPPSARFCLVLKLHVELLQLPLTLLAGALLLDSRSRIARPRVIRPQIGTPLKRSLLIHVQLLLPQGLVELQLIDCLALAGVGWRIH